jgi:hypothetical protein
MGVETGPGAQAPQWVNLPGEKLGKLYFAVGVALAAWQSVETNLTQLFCILVRPEDGTASAAFNAFPSFPTKLRMLEAAAAVRLAESNLLKPCVGLCKRLEGVARKRNQLVHFTLFQESFIGKTDPEKFAREVDWYLAPTAFDGARNWRHKGMPPKLKLVDVQRHAKAFDDASVSFAVLPNRSKLSWPSAISAVDIVKACLWA